MAYTPFYIPDDLNPAQAERHNDGKVPMSLVLDAPHALAGQAAVMAAGQKKYSRANWLKGQTYNTVLDSMMRHILAIARGEDIDPESGLPHIDHVQCNAAFLSEFYHTGRTDLDDRIHKNGL